MNVEIFGDCDLNKVKDSVESITEEVIAKLPKVWEGFVNRQYQLW